MATQSTSYVIRGQLKDGGVGGPVASAGVCVLDAATHREIGTAETDSAGWFSISLSSDQADIALGGGSAVSLLFAFTASGGLIGGFEKSISRAEMKSAAVHDFTVGSATPGSNPYFIGGTVVDSEGAAISGATVEFYEHVLPSASRTSIGTTTTDPNGNFLFNYSYTGSSDPDSVRTTIVAIAEVSVMGIPTEAGQSGPHCNPSKNHVMRIVIPKDAATGAPIPSDLSEVEYRGVPEYDQLVGRIGAVVVSPPPGDLTAEDIQALACRTGYTASEIAVWASAYSLAGQTTIDEEAIYALGRLGVPLNVGALLTLADADVQSGLEDAVDRGLLSESYSSSIAATVTAFGTERVSTTLTDPASSTPTVTAEMLTNAGLSTPRQEVFFTQLYANTLPIETFWANLRADTTNFPGDSVDRIQFVMRAGAVAANHTPLVEYLQNNKWGTELATARDLAKYSETDFAGFLALPPGAFGGTVGAPASFPGADQAEREANYAKAVSRAVDDVFATEAVAYRVTSSAITTDVSGFVSENAEFDFRTTVIDDFWTGASIPSGVTDPDALKAELKTIQRVFNIAPRIGRVDAVKALLDNGVRSAFQVSQFGAAAFAKKFATAMGSKQAAKRAWKRADQIASKNLAIWAKFNPNLAVSNAYALPTPGCGLADLETLFGGADYCACEPCLSVYSPAAYMVEILVWLENRDSNTPGTSLLDILEDSDLANGHSRSDIRHTLLNCENTETPLPTIDIVNEILERVVIEQDGGNPTYDEPQTTWTADELRAHPENLDDQAYSILENAAKGVHPWTLPFSLSLEEARVYLEHLGAKRADIMEAMALFPFQNGGDDEVIARRDEHAGLSEAQADMVVKPTTVVASAASQWGVTLISEIENLRTFMSRSGLSYEQVLDLLKCEVASGISITFTNGDCDVDAGVISPISAAKATELQSFLRLAGATGWTVRELDAMLRLTNSSLDSEANAAVAVAHVADIKKLMKRIPGLSLGEVLAWYGGLDVVSWVDDQPSFYEQITYPNQLSDGWAIGTIDVGGAGSFDSVGGELAGVASISEEDLGHIAALLGWTGATAITLSEASTAYSLGSQARAAGLSVKEYLALRELNGTTGSLPGGQREGERMEIIFDDADLIRSSGASVAAVEFVVLHRNADDFKASDDAIALDLVGLMEGLKQVAADEAANVPAEDLSAEDRMASVLGRLYRPNTVNNDLENALLIAAGTYTYGGGSDLVVNALFDFVDDAPTMIELRRSLETRAIDQETVAAVVVAHAAAKLQKEALESFAIQYWGQLYGLQAADTKLFLDTFEPSSLPGTPALEHFTASAFWSIEIDAAQISEEGFGATFVGQAEVDTRAALARRIQKAALVTTLHGYAGPALAWIMAPPSAFSSNVLDLDALPTSEQTPDANTPDDFYAWMWLVLVASIRGRFAEENGVFEVLDEVVDLAPEANILNALGVATGIDQAEIDELFADASTVVPAAYASVHPFVEFFKVHDLAQRMGVTTKTLRLWANTHAPTSVQADGIRGAARAKHPASAWPDIAEPIRNRVREKQRDALADWLVSKLSLNSVEDLLDGLLIDTQVSACARTSRIKSAISSLQLFIQRAFLQLEPEIDLDQDDSIEWDWMKRYRVWEASRKIFLYPENYLAPELRQDKTPLFKQLEDDIMQGDVTEANVERAYLRYLQGLDEVGRLDIAGVYHEVERDADDEVVLDRLHVFGKTKTSPRKVFYRTRESGVAWSPWEELPFDVGDPDVLPVVYNRKLLVFWPSIEERSIEPSNEGEDKTVGLKISINWAELIDGEWVGPYRSGSSARMDSIPKGQFRPRNLKRQAKRRYFGFWLQAHETEEGDLVVDVAHWIEPPEIGPLKAILLGQDDDDEGAAPFMISASLVSEEMAGVFEIVGHFRYGGCGGGLDRIPDREYFSPQKEWLVRNMPANVGVNFQSLRSTLSSNEVRLTAPDPSSKKPAIMKKPLIKLPSSFHLDGHRHTNGALVLHPFFVADRHRTFFFDPRDENRSPGAGKSFQDDRATGEALQGANNMALLGSQVLDAGAATEAPTKAWPNYNYVAATFYHPYICDMVKQVRKYGVSGLLNAPDESSAEGSHLACQAASQALMYKSGTTPLAGELYPVSDNVRGKYPVEDIDFSPAGAYSIYNWELFFHAPLFIADRLIAEQKFDEARKWLHYIFDPTQGEANGSCPSFWRIRPFKDADSQQSIQDLLDVLAADGSDEGKTIQREQIEADIELWRDNPFDPHLVARFRPEAYQRAVFFKYVDLLVEWGDHLFRQDTIEANNEASQLYILAKKLLGNRPVMVEGHEAPAAAFDDATSFDAFSNFLVDAENTTPNMLLEAKLVNPADQNPMAIASNNFMPLTPVATELQWMAPQQPKYTMMAVVVDVGGQNETQSYFCLPPSDNLTSYWDTVDDRLFKLRNCLNIDGVFRQLPLFQPPIDPALLAQAAAAGLDIASAVAGLNAALPHYKFRTMLNMAKELVSEVRNFGGMLLSALEKRDAEALSRLRAQQDVGLQKIVQLTRELQVQEAEAAMEATVVSKQNAQERFDYYNGRARKSEREKLVTGLDVTSKVLNGVSMGINTLSAALGAIPNFNIGFVSRGPETTASVGSAQFMAPLNATAQSASTAAFIASSTADMFRQEAVFDRRKEDWQLQASLATADLESIGAQELTAKIRKQITERELKNHQRIQDNVAEVESFLSGKFTNEELYFWMEKEVSKLYYQAYKLAVDVARRAERCLQYELADNSQSFVSYGYWDNTKKGLLAGERLAHDLRRMEVAYLENHRREYEITKRISLAELDPIALEELKSIGECTFDVPEWYLDLDHPSHYMRRIKMVSVTLPSVTGPFSDVSATLTYERGSMRRDTVNPPELDPMSTVETIAISTGQEDTGMFEPNMRDERYLPFEGKGLDDSVWRLKLPYTARQYDYRTLTDAIVTVRYMAREGGDTLRGSKAGSLVTKLGSGPLHHVVSTRASFPDAWAQFLSEGLAGNDAVAQLELSEQDFPFAQLAGKSISVTKVHAYVWRGEGDNQALSVPTLTDVADVAVTTLSAFAQVWDDGQVTEERLVKSESAVMAGTAPATWKFTIPSGFSGGTAEDEPRDLLLVFEYKLA